jgi:hypothetical protein
MGWFAKVRWCSGELALPRWVAGARRQVRWRRIAVGTVVGGPRVSLRGRAAPGPWGALPGWSYS